MVFQRLEIEGLRGGEARGEDRREFVDLLLKVGIERN